MNSDHTCLEGISFDSPLNEDGKYYSQVLLKECKYIYKKLLDNILIT